MIAAAQERARAGEAGAHDSVLIEFCDGERDLFGLLRVTRLPGAGRSELLAILFAGGQPVISDMDSELPLPEGWEDAGAGGAVLQILTPLEHWRASYGGDGGGFDLDLAAASLPVDFDAPPAANLARVSGTHGYEQLCSVRGSVQVGGREMRVEGIGRRVHSWGQLDPSSVTTARSVFAFAEGSGMTVAAIRPADATDHGHELIAGHLLDRRLEPLALEQVRLSTVYDRSGRPREASLELLAPGEEMPRRVAGEATCGISIESDDAVTWLAFFRWAFEGKPAIGSYQLRRRK